MSDHEFQKGTEQLKELIKGLVIMSEKDSVLSLIDFENPELVELIMTANSEQAYLERLRKRITTDKDWFSEKRREQTRRFRDLFEWMDKSLQNLQLVRIGDAEATVYVFGEANGRKRGFSFKVLET